MSIPATRVRRNDHLHLGTSGRPARRISRPVSILAGTRRRIEGAPPRRRRILLPSPRSGSRGGHRDENRPAPPGRPGAGLPVAGARRFSGSGEGDRRHVCHHCRVPAPTLSDLFDGNALPERRAVPRRARHDGRRRPGRPTTFYRGRPAAAVLRTTDSGATWERWAERIQPLSADRRGPELSGPNVLYVGGWARRRSAEWSYVRRRPTVVATRAGASSTSAWRRRGRSRIDPIHPKDRLGPRLRAGGGRSGDRAPTGASSAPPTADRAGRSRSSSTRGPGRLGRWRWTDISRASLRRDVSGEGSVGRSCCRAGPAAASTGRPTAATPGRSWPRGSPRGRGKGRRLGLAGQAGRVYAIVEAEKGGVFRSEDLGERWTKVNDEQRPLRQCAWYYTRSRRPGERRRCLRRHVSSTAPPTAEGCSRSRPHGDNHDLWIDPASRAGWSRGRRRRGQPRRGTELVDALQPADGAVLPRRRRREVPLLDHGAQQDNCDRGDPEPREGAAIERTDWHAVGGCESGWVVPKPRELRRRLRRLHGGSITLTTTGRRGARGRRLAAAGDRQAARDLKYRFQWNRSDPRSKHDRALFPPRAAPPEVDRRGGDWTKRAPT